MQKVENPIFLPVTWTNLEYVSFNEQFRKKTLAVFASGSCVDIPSPRTKSATA